MQEITIGPDLSDQLGQVPQQVVVCDAHGRALGLFQPLPNHPALADLQLEPPLSIAETEELRKVQTGKPLAEILTRMGNQ